MYDKVASLYRFLAFEESRQVSDKFASLYHSLAFEENRQMYE